MSIAPYGAIDALEVYYGQQRLLPLYAIFAHR